MPDYEFYCDRCKRTFDVFMSIKAHDGTPAECPSCHQTDLVEKRLSVVNVKTSRKSSG